MLQYKNHADTWINLQVKAVRTKFKINYKLKLKSDNNVVSIDRGPTTDRYSATITVDGKSDYIDQLTKDIWDLINHKKSLIIKNDKDGIFGDHISTTNPYECVVINYVPIKSNFKGKRSIKIELLLTNATVLPNSFSFTGLKCMSQNYSIQQSEVKTINESYTRNVWYNDHHDIVADFKGDFMLTKDQTKELLSYWSHQRGTPFSISDTQFGIKNMFGSVIGTGNHDVVISDIKVSPIGPTQRKVTIKLLKQNYKE